MQAEAWLQPRCSLGPATVRTSDGDVQPLEALLSRNRPAGVVPSGSARGEDLRLRQRRGITGAGAGETDSPRYGWQSTVGGLSARRSRPCLPTWKQCRRLRAGPQAVYLVTLFPSGEAEQETRLLDGASRPPDGGGFGVHLANFDGPFDLLPHLISRHKLDITEIALSQVTDEFISYIKAAGTGWDLDQTSQFMVVAATLLDLKAARLIPSGEVEDPEDLALLEARDLLFGAIAAVSRLPARRQLFAATLEAQGRRFPRDVGMEPRFARLMPEVTISISPARLAALSREGDGAEAGHRAVARPHACTCGERARAGQGRGRPVAATAAVTYRALTHDSSNMLTTVARFLALLELFRDGAVAFEQLTPLGELTVRWTGADDGEWVVSDEFDETPEPPEADQ